MRIVSGKYRSRIIKAPENNLTRPTSDIVRESLFNVINGKCINANCIDIFAGSGALGIEALSRGAKKCVFIDNNYLAIKTINENLNSLKEQNYKIYKYLDRLCEWNFLQRRYFFAQPLRQSAGRPL